MTLSPAPSGKTNVGVHFKQRHETSKFDRRAFVAESKGTAQPSTETPATAQDEQQPEPTTNRVLDRVQVALEAYRDYTDGLAAGSEPDPFINKLLGKILELDTGDDKHRSHNESQRSGLPARDLVREQATFIKNLERQIANSEEDLKLTQKAREELERKTIEKNLKSSLIKEKPQTKKLSEADIESRFEVLKAQKYIKEKAKSNPNSSFAKEQEKRDKALKKIPTTITKYKEQLKALKADMEDTRQIIMPRRRRSSPAPQPPDSLSTSQFSKAS